ncbi:MAG: tetratricopeptide repeat protein [Candidatus Latescibacteria bacterium]|nr:tetratricopeptide repeat protein [bacterium]MBD3423506.1 tetratricopeptide repeat protein [Candidatus Latescibacterota bacterium]
MLKSLFVISLQLLALISFCTDAGGQEYIPLDQKLEGLGPEPRISYLRYLIGNQEADSRVFFHLGVAFHEMGRADSAIHYYQEAVREDSTMFKALVNLGVLYDEKGNMMKAVENYQAALKVRPQDVLASTQLGALYYRTEAYDTAIEYIRRALNSDRSHPQPHYYLGNYFADSGIYREAIREWEKVIELGPGTEAASRARKNIRTVRNAMKEPSMLDSLELRDR